jgi:integrase
MAKYSKKFESWGGRELIAVINGKVTGVKKDIANNTFFYRHPQSSGRANKINLGRNKGKAAGKWWVVVEEHQKEQFQALPTEQLKTRKILRVKRQSHQTEKEFDAMINLFIETAAKQKDETVEEWNERVFDNPNIASFVKEVETLIPENILASIFNKWLEDPFECSKKLGREEIANLSKLTPKDPINLCPMGQYYFDYIPTNRHQASEKERKKVFKWWEQFCRIINKNYLDDVKKLDIKKYTGTIVDIAIKQKHSNTWISHRFGAVKTVINIFAKSLEDKTVPNRIIAWLKDYPAPSTKSKNGTKFNPKPLTKQQLRELLSVVEGKWKAIILFSLNTCSYGVGCRDVMMKHIDLDNKTLTMWRKKKSVPKCSVLWDETVDAIRKFRKGKMAKSPYVFPSRYGSKYSEGGFYDYWSHKITPNVSWDFDFQQIRDAGRYGAEKGGASPNHIKIVMGHRIEGVDDAYLFRHPELVSDVNESIYNYYFS